METTPPTPEADDAAPQSDHEPPIAGASEPVATAISSVAAETAPTALALPKQDSTVDRSVTHVVNAGSTALSEGEADSSLTTGAQPEVEADGSTPAAIDEAALTFSEDELLNAASYPETGDTFGIDDPPPSDQFPPPGRQFPPPPNNSFMPPPPPPTSPPPPPPGATHQLERRVYRSRHDRMIGGVCGGLAEYFQIDPTLVRIAAVVLFFSGPGFILYPAAWILIPKRPVGYGPQPRSGAQTSDRMVGVVLGIAAIALVVSLTASNMSLFAIALIGGGIWLLSEKTAANSVAVDERTGPAPSSYTAPSQYAQTSYQRPYAAPNDNYGVPYVPAPPRGPQKITRVVLASIGLLAVIAIAAATVGLSILGPGWFMGTALVIIAVGVLLGQINGGGARGLIPIALLTAILLVPAAAVDGLVANGVGEVTFTPETLTEIEGSYEHGIGKLKLDFSEVDFAGESKTVDVDLGVGEVIVIVSETTGGTAEIKNNAGEVSQVWDESQASTVEGVDLSTQTLTLPGDDGTLILDIELGVGSVELIVAD